MNIFRTTELSTFLYKFCIQLTKKISTHQNYEFFPEQSITEFARISKTLILLVILYLNFFSFFPAFALTSIKAGDMEITSKLMTFQDNMYVARGGMKATQKDSVLTSERGIYDRNLELVKAIDKVEVKQPGSVLTSDYLEAYVKEDRILAKGNPKLIRITERQNKDSSGEIKGKKSRVILTCDEVEGFNKENRYLAKGNVHVIEVPYREGETDEEAKENEGKPVSDLKCETLEIFSTEDKAIARNDVKIVTKTMKANGDKAIYLDKENRMIIVGHAHAIQSSKETPDAQEQVSELFATKLIYYPNEDRTIAVGEVHATVYPKGSKLPSEGDENGKDKKKKKKGKKEKDEEEEKGGGKKGKTPKKGTDKDTTSEEESPANENEESVSADKVKKEIESIDSEKTSENIPEGNYTPIGNTADEKEDKPANKSDDSKTKETEQVKKE
ncbi:MAG: hypothetical protein HQM08_11920 [Candidatus Riflebacteria bacterium]|nr:hypothetical protein [Candidatus Riflebacteria bacterium]